jgi:hypothetical protein
LRRKLDNARGVTAGSDADLDATLALQAIPPAERLAGPEWQALISEAGLDPATVGFVEAAVGVRIGAPPGSMVFLSAASVFATTDDRLLLIEPPSDGGRVVVRALSEVTRLGESPNGTYTDIVFDAATGDQWRIRDPQESIRDWFLTQGERRL